jgi:hypothetical protein
MNGNVYDLPLVVHSGQGWQQNKVARGRHRQKLGHALNKGHKYQMKQSHTD